MTTWSIVGPLALTWLAAFVAAALLRARIGVLGVLGLAQVGNMLASTVRVATGVRNLTPFPAIEVFLWVLFGSIAGILALRGVRRFSGRLPLGRRAMRWLAR